MGREAPTLPQDLGNNVGLEVGEPEVAAEAYSEMGGSPIEEDQEQLSDTELDDKGTTRKNNAFSSFLLEFLCFNLLVHVSTSSSVSGAIPRQPPPVTGAPGRI